MADIAIDSRQASWSERLSISGIFLITGFGVGAWAAYIPTVKADLMLSDGMLSVALLTFAAGAVISMPAAGMLAPHFGTGRSTRSAAFVFAASMTLPLLASSLVLLVLATFLMGAAKGVLDVVMNAHASAVEQRWGKPIMSSIHGSFSLGGLLGAAMGSLLMGSGLSGGSVLVIAAIFAAMTAGATWNALSYGVKTGGKTVLKLPSRGILILCLLAGCCMMCEGAMADWSAVYLATVGEASPALAAVGYAAFSASMFIGRFVGDSAVQLLGRRKVVALGGLLATVGLTIIVVCPIRPIAAASFGLVGLGLSNVVPVLLSAASRFGKDGAGARGIAMVATAGYAGFLIGPVIIGATATVAGLQMAFVLLAACLALVMPLTRGAHVE